MASTLSTPLRSMVGAALQSEQVFGHLPSPTTDSRQVLVQLVFAPGCPARKPIVYVARSYLPIGQPDCAAYTLSSARAPLASGHLDRVKGKLRCLALPQQRAGSLEEFQLPSTLTRSDVLRCSLCRYSAAACSVPTSSVRMCSPR